MPDIFSCLEQRVVAVKIASLSDFFPAENISASIESQRAFYDFYIGAHRAIFEDISLLFSTTHPDDFFTRRFNHAADNKPKLQAQMNAAFKALEEFERALFDMADKGRFDGATLIAPKEVKLKRQHIAALKVKCEAVNGERRFDFSSIERAIDAWRYLALAGFERFSRCEFDARHSYIADVFARELGDIEAFRLLEDYFTEKNYERVERRGGMFALDYAKEYAPKPSPIKDAWAERTHGGVEFKFREIDTPPQTISLRAPYIKEVLAKSDEMSDSLKEFFARNIKKCDGCRFCVQTDKTGERPLAHIAVESGGAAHKLCPLFPGYSLCWTRLDAQLARELIAAFEFFDKTLAR